MENPKNTLEKIREEGSLLRREVRERTLGYLTGALGFVAGLAWNDAIKTLIEHIFPLGQNSLVAKFVYAAVVTIAVVIGTTYLARALGNSTKDP